MSISIKTKIYSSLKKTFFYSIMFFLSVVFLNFSCWIILRLRMEKKVDDRYLLPVYQDKNYSKQIFEEFNTLKTDYYSYIEWRRLKFIGKTTHINEQGYRYNPNMRNVAFGKNVCFLGGSTMWGTGVDDFNTIPSIWNNLKGNNNFNGVNLGESGFDSRQSLESFINLIVSGKKIDCVVCYVGVNEISRCRKIITSNSHVYEKTFRDKINEDNSYPRYMLYRYTQTLIKDVYNKIKKNKNDDYQYQCDCNAKRTEVVAETMFSNLKIIKHLVESQGGIFIAILQPVIYVGNPDKSYLQKYTNNVFEKEDLNYRALYEKILSLRESKYQWLINFTHAFDKRKNIYIDHCHVGNQGNRIIAEKLDSLIKTQHLL